MGMAVSEVIALIAGLMALYFIFRVGEAILHKLTRDERDFK